MAKWGEGDPRWIVEERPDATNVNNWHWTEKNASQWSQDCLRKLMVDFKLDNSVGPCKIVSVEKCEGDASANNRKAKIIVFFEWELTLKWKAQLNGKDVTGTIFVPNLSDENTMEDLDIQFKTEEKTVDAQLLKEALRTECEDAVKEQLNKYILALKEEFTKGMILPKKDTSVNSNMSKLSLSSSSSVESSSTTVFNKGGVNGGNVKAVGQKLDLCDITSTATMKCAAHDVYGALTRPEMFIAFTNGSGHIEPKVGGTFSMFGGNVHGKILELDPPSKIVQEWRFKHWPDGHFSTVTFTIEERNDSTEVTVHQRGVPRREEEVTREGWDKYYWDAMKRTFGFGSYIL